MAERGALLAALAERPRDPFRLAVGGTTRRGELAAQAEAVAGRLARAGWRAGQRLALLAEPTGAFDAVLVGGLAAGLDLLLLPLREPPEARARLAAAAGAAATAGGGPGALSAFLAAPASPAPGREPLSGASDPSRVWIRSSGSLGRARWVLHSERSLLAAADPAARRLDFGPGARWGLSLPMDHVGGLALLARAAVSGGALLETGAGSPSHLSLVATQLRRRLAEGAAGELAGLDRLLLGGGPVDGRLRREALRLGLPLVVSYGLSETAALCCLGLASEEPERVLDAGWVGRPLRPDTLRADGAGAVHVRGPALCVAVAGDDGRPQAPPLEAGWLPTGDLGAQAADGSLSIFGRRDLVIQSGGEKLAAEELEEALLALEGVLEAVVVPVPDEEFGQRPAAFLRLESGGPPELSRLREALAGAVARWKLPVAAWPLPASAGLKPDRLRLARLAAERWQRGARRP